MPSNANNDGIERKKFCSLSVLSQTIVDRVVKKYHILYIYFYQTPEDREFMSNPRPREIVISIIHLEFGIRFPFHKFFNWLILFGSAYPTGAQQFEAFRSFYHVPPLV